MKRGTPLRIPEGILNWRASKETHGELGGIAVPEVLRWEQRRGGWRTVMGRTSVRAHEEEI